MHRTYCNFCDRTQPHGQQWPRAAKHKTAPILRWEGDTEPEPITLQFYVDTPLYGTGDLHICPACLRLLAFQLAANMPALCLQKESNP